MKPRRPMRFTFKKIVHTGRYRSFERDYTDIKLNGLMVGGIRENIDGSYNILLAVCKDPQPNDTVLFKWISLKKTFDTEDGARQFLTKRCEDIIQRFDLYSFPKE